MEGGHHRVAVHGNDPPHQGEGQDEKDQGHYKGLGPEIEVQLEGTLLLRLVRGGCGRLFEHGISSKIQVDLL